MLLPDAPQKPELPLFLRGRIWVDFRQNHPEPIGQLIWGITGNRPTYEEGLSLETMSRLILPDQAANQESSDLEKLEILLSAQKWREADEQTKHILLKENQSNLLTAPQIRQLPLNLIDSVDQLWRSYSNEKFGLRIQRRLWQESLEPKKLPFDLRKPFAVRAETVTESQAWNRFGCLVGWRDHDEKALPDTKLNFSMKAPIGCFPQTRRWLHNGYGNTVKQFVALMERVAQLD